MNLKKTEKLLNLLAPNSEKNEDNLQKSLTDIITSRDILFDEQTETIDDSLRRSFSDSELFIPVKSCLKYKKPLSAQERSTKLQNVHSISQKSNCNDEVTVLYAGPRFRRKHSKSFNASGETNCNQQKPEIKIFFHSTFESSEQTGQHVNSMFGRHNNLQDRYKNRPIILHSEENRKQLKVPDKALRRRRHHNSPAKKSHFIVCESNEDTNNGSSNLKKNGPQDQNECNAIPINQIFDITSIDTFHKMHSSNIMQGIIMVNIDKMNCSSSRIAQIKNCNIKTNRVCSPVIIRFLSQRVSKLDPTFDRHFTANKICKRTNELRMRFHDIALTNANSVSNMSEKIFRKRTFRSRKTRIASDNKRE